MFQLKQMVVGTILFHIYAMLFSELFDVSSAKTFLVGAERHLVCDMDKFCGMSHTNFSYFFSFTFCACVLDVQLSLTQIG